MKHFCDGTLEDEHRRGFEPCPPAPMPPELASDVRLIQARFVGHIALPKALFCAMHLQHEVTELVKLGKLLVNPAMDGTYMRGPTLYEN